MIHKTKDLAPAALIKWTSGFMKKAVTRTAFKKIIQRMFLTLMLN